MLRFVISHPEAVSHIAIPLRDRVVAIQKTVNGTCENAPQREGEGSAGSRAIAASEFKLQFPYEAFADFPAPPTSL